MFELRDAKPSIADRVAARTAAWPASRSPFGVLCRAFFAQFFTSETVSSEIRLHQATSGVFTLLLMPALMMTMNGCGTLQAAEFRARQLHASGMLEPVLASLASTLITYSMVTVSVVAVIEWNALGFDRRDAMVLGPLPIRGSMIIAAKLAALGALLVATSALVTVVPTASFALATAEPFGPMGFIRYFAAYMLATLGAAVFVFAAIVMFRGTIALLAGAHLAIRVGSLLQGLFVSALVTWVLMAMVTAGRPQARTRAFELAGAVWMPTGWFLALFERVRGATEPDVVAGAGRAVLATTIALGGAVLVSIAGFTRHSQLALAPSSSVGALTRVRLGRALARLITGSDPVAQATAHFILLTLARCRAQQDVMAINMAFGAALVLAGLVRAVTDVTSLTQPRTAVLWIPLVLAYSLTIGLRASFFVPSELRGSWTFRINGPSPAKAYWSATRASMMVLVLPLAALVAAAVLVPLVGWYVAAMHTLYTCAIVTVLIELVALTIDFVPFTRAYPPGHANLKSLWWVYVLGLFAFAYWPARLELWSIRTNTSMLGITAWLALAIMALEVVGRRRSAHKSMPEHEDLMDESLPLTVLDLGTVRR